MAICHCETSTKDARTLSNMPRAPQAPLHWTKMTKFRKLSSCTPPEPRAQMVGYTCESYAQTMAKSPGCQHESRITVHCSLAAAQSTSEQSPIVQARLRRATTWRRGATRRCAGAAAPRLSATHKGRPQRRRWRRGALPQKWALRAQKHARGGRSAPAQQSASIVAICPNLTAVFDSCSAIALRSAPYSILAADLT